MNINKNVALLYFSVVDLIKKLDSKRIFYEALKNELMTRDGLIELQKKKLTSLIENHAPLVSGYREKYHGYNVSDFSNLPVLEKKEIVSAPSKFLATNYLGKCFKGSTSGSTGDSLIFYYDSERLAWAEASKWRARRWFNVNKGDSCLVIWGYPIYHSNINKMFLNPIKNILRNEVFINTFNSLEKNLSENVFTLTNSRKFNMIYGYGSSIGKIALDIKKRGWKLDSNQAPEIIQYTADHMSFLEKKAAEYVFNSRVISDYGASEVPGIAEECPNGNLHISIDSYYVEIIDENGRCKPDGETGDICVTDLHNKAMPLIRYRVGDVGCIVPGFCSCGSQLPMMELVVGKSVELINTIDIKNISSHYLDYINLKLLNQGLRGIIKFKLFQYSLNEFVLYVLPGEENLETSVKLFVDEFIKKFGKVNLEVKVVEDIPLENTGKHRYFVNMMK